MNEEHNENQKECPCPKTACPNHGDCKACALHHKQLGNLVFCRRDETRATGADGSPFAGRGRHGRGRSSRSAEYTAGQDRGRHGSWGRHVLGRFLGMGRMGKDRQECDRERHGHGCGRDPGEHHERDAEHRGPCGR